MLDLLQTTLIALSLVLAAATAFQVAFDRPIGPVLLWIVTLLELGLLAQAGIGIGQLVSQDRDINGLVYVGYLLGTLVFLPIATLWALGERSRAGTAVLLVAALVVPVLIVRTQQVWTASSG
jgi:hypothetical protein